MLLENKIALVTGGSRGIGRATARLFAQEGATVIFTDLKQNDDSAALLNELQEYNPELLVKDRVLAVTKCDLIDKQIEKDIEPTLPKDIPHVFISSMSQEGLKELKETLWEALHK